jgi:MarR family transcriptional regulator, organic hydroperoxide resistance regulator
MTHNVTEITERGEIANRLFFRLYQSSNLMHKVGTSAVSAYGITTQQWAVLGALSREGVKEAGLNVKELVEYLMVSRQSLSAVLNRLEEVDLVERVQARGDQRLRLVRLTSKGVKIWSDMRPNIMGFYEASLADFSTEECMILRQLLTRLSAGIAKV